jgi:outer membrane protein OmpA-like peptidoglycan-associated protein/tetratricopeptide (TPR) repeat protein
MPTAMRHPYKIVTLIFLGIFFSSFCANAQSKDEKKILKKARKQLSLGEYEDAKQEYEKLVKINANSSEYWFEAGLAYYNSNLDREKSIEYFERARAFTAKKENGELLQSDTIGEVFYYLGRAYQFIGRFEDAMIEYNNFKEFVKNSRQGDVLGRDVNRYIAMCNNGNALARDVNDGIIIENMGGNINSRHPEYASVVNEDETIIIFTGRRDDATGDKFYHDNKHFEDIYVSVMEGDEWIRASRIDSSNKYISSHINSKYHDAAIAYSHDEKKLFIYRKNDVWQSELANGKWSDPVRLNNNINTSGHEPSVFISSDGGRLFVVSDRKEGMGGRDIYVSEKQADGTWGPVSPFAAINTPYDEDAPFLTADGKTMYYSSNGEASIGGYDIFKVELQPDGKWSAPINVGMPINTPGDDIYYTENQEGTVAFYSSSKPFGLGDMDIYRVQLRCKTIPNTEIRGLIVSGENFEPVGGRVIVTDNETGDDVGTFNVNPETGEYLLVLPPDKNYHLKVEAGFYLPHNEDFYVPRQCEFYQMYQEVYIKYLTDTSWSGFFPEKAVFSNAMFDVKSHIEDMYEINNLDAEVKEHQSDMAPSGDRYADIVSQVEHNDVLRAGAVTVHLINDQQEIVATTATNEDGFFRFREINTTEKYGIMLDEEDSKISYYGDSPNNNENSIRILGDVFYDKMNGDPVSDMNIYLADKSKLVVNMASTDETGHFVMDNLPDATQTDLVEKVNKDNTWPYNVEPTTLNQMYSALVKTIDPENTDVTYTEVIDLIDIEMIMDLYSDSIFVIEPDLLAFKDILFDFDRHFLRGESKDELDKIVAYMKENPTITLDIAGHTDWKGSNEYNVALSKKRTDAAYNYLVANGIEDTRLNKTWHGEVQPTAANANPDGSDNEGGRQLNRRVEFQIKVQTETAELTFNF